MLLCIIDFYVIWFFSYFKDIILVRPTYHTHRRTKFPWSIVIYCNPMSIILPWGIISRLGLGAWSLQVGFLCSIYVMIYRGSKLWRSPRFFSISRVVTMFLYLQETISSLWIVLLLFYALPLLGTLVGSPLLVTFSNNGSMQCLIVWQTM